MKYLIHTHYVGTHNNPNFAGETEDWYSGKEGRSKKVKSVDELSDCFVNHCGYSRKCDAQRVLNRRKDYAESEMKHGYWKITVQMYEVEG